MINPRDALAAIGHLPDGEIDIADAALQLARVDLPESDWLGAREHLSAIARDAAAQAADMAADIPDDDLTARAAGLSALLSGRYGYAGDTESYDDLANANLMRVIERRRGLPVALGILWLHAARASGWPAHGIDFPGHFLIGLAGHGEQLVLDVFAGGVPMDAAALRGLLEQIEGEGARLRPGLLQPMPARAVLLRLQNNIRTRRLQAGALPEALACAEDMLRIAPDQALLWRETALINQRLDHLAAALRCFERFLELVPEGDAAIRARESMHELRSRLN